MDIELRRGHLPFLGLKRGFVAEMFDLSINFFLHM